MREQLDIRKKYGDDFYNHLKYGGALSVKIMRDLASIPKENCWADVLSVGFHKNKKRIIIDFFIVELYPKLSEPNYAGKTTGIDKRFETWSTARKDIEVQKKNGMYGDIYLVVPKLYNKNNEYKLVEAVNRRGRKYTKKVAVNPEWTYKILFCKKISRKEYKYIDKRKNRICEKIGKSKGFVDKKFFCLKEMS